MAVRMSATIRTGPGRQPGSVTSTGMTFDIPPRTRPALAALGFNLTADDPRDPGRRHRSLQIARATPIREA